MKSTIENRRLFIVKSIFKDLNQRSLQGALPLDHGEYFKREGPFGQPPDRLP